MIERLIGIALFADAARRMETLSVHPKLSGDQIREMIRRLKDDWLLTPQASDHFKAEYLFWNHTIEAAQSGNPAITWDNLDMDGMSNPMLMYLMGEPERGTRIVRFYFSNRLAFADLPRYKRPPTVGHAALFDDPAGLRYGEVEWSIAEFDAALAESPLANQSLPGTEPFLKACDNDATRFATILCVLAGQAYYRDHGEFPKSPADLVPDYLARIHSDPIDGRPLRYRRDVDNAIVYSIGENGVDDGGDVNGNNAGDIGYRLIAPGALPLVAPPPPKKPDDAPF